MKGYKLTKEQKNSIEKQSFGKNQYFNPVKDINGDWFIFETEMNDCVKNKGWQKSTLSEFIPPEIELGYGE